MLRLAQHFGKLCKMKMLSTRTRFCYLFRHTYEKKRRKKYIKCSHFRWLLVPRATHLVFIYLFILIFYKTEKMWTEEKAERGGSLGDLTMRKIGGSRGNPPCVSCHWSSARRVPAKDCIGHLSRFLPSASYLLSKSKSFATRDVEQRYSPTHLIQKMEVLFATNNVLE